MLQPAMTILVSLCSMRFCTILTLSPFSKLNIIGGVTFVK